MHQPAVAHALVAHGDGKLADSPGVLSMPRTLASSMMPHVPHTAVTALPQLVVVVVVVSLPGAEHGGPHLTSSSSCRPTSGL